MGLENFSNTYFNHEFHADAPGMLFKRTKFSRKIHQFLN